MVKEKHDHAPKDGKCVYCNAEVTHILIRVSSQDREDLYRSDGMLVASRQADAVRFGIEPKEAGNRFFLTPEHAGQWLRKLAGMEMVTRQGTLRLADAVERGEYVEPLIEERDGESVIVQPSGSPRQIYKH